MTKVTSRIVAVILIFAMAVTMAYGSTAHASETEPVLAAGTDDSYAAQLVRQLGGDDGLYKQGLNGFDMYDYLGYVYMGWRTTGGIWQNHIINDFIMSELAGAGYTTTDADVEAAYGTKPDSDKSDQTDDDYAWVIQYQETEEQSLGYTWDPEYSSLKVQLVREDGTPFEDEQGSRLAELVGGEWWAYNPTTEVYQKHFADEFGMDYQTEIAALPDDTARVKAMHRVLMSSNVEKDDRTGVDDYRFIARSSIDQLNKEAVLNKRTRLASESCFTDPAGTDPADAKGLDGEFIYVGTVNPREGTNSEGISPEEIAGKIILTDSAMWNGFDYAYNCGAVGVASKAAVEAFLCPKDENGDILQPWYDSSRFSSGGYLEDTISLCESGQPIIEWQFSNQQYDSLKALLERAKIINEQAESEADKVKVTGRQIAIGQTYPMTKTAGSPGVGQAVAIAEVKGSVHPEKRILICAHVQEPGCNDNATGAAALLGMAAEYKRMVDAGEIARPKCTITFMWGDEMNMADYWTDGHEEETKNLIAALDMDMVGEDPEKTGGVMRIEKTPDPSANSGYTLDAVPWNEPDQSIPSSSNPHFDENYRSTSDDSFVRLPDSHTLWGESYVGDEFRRGWYLNDLYMYATNTVISKHDADFRVEVCPYEGGSDHSVFLEKNIPALLTWHFTDYVYHTSSDTLYMASPREMESVAITTLTTALLIGDSCDDSDFALQILGIIEDAALKRMDTEKTNTDHHLQYVLAGNASYEDALANEEAVLKAWGDWYAEAIESAETLADNPSEELTAAVASSKEKLAAKVQNCLDYAGDLLKQPEPPTDPISIEGAPVVLSAASFTYNGKVQKPVIRTIDSRELTEGTDYDAEWPASSKNAGSYTVIIRGKGNYTGQTSASYKINAKPVTPSVKLAANSYTYNGKRRTPAVTVADGSTVLKKDRDYKVTYASGRTNVGSYKVTVKLQGNYSGSGSAVFKINPKGTKLGKLSGGSKSATVNWTKQASKMASSRITGYQIQLATNSKFTRNKKTVNISGYKTVSKKVTKLLSGKKYYVRIRTYKKIKNVNYYSAWSKVKTVKTV